MDSITKGYGRMSGALLTLTVRILQNCIQSVNGCWVSTAECVCRLLSENDCCSDTRDLTFFADCLARSCISYSKGACCFLSPSVSVRLRPINDAKYAHRYVSYKSRRANQILWTVKRALMSLNVADDRATICTLRLHFRRFLHFLHFFVTFVFLLLSYKISNIYLLN